MNEEPGSTSRQTWGLIIGGALGLLVVGAVLMVSLGAGDGGSSDPQSDGPPVTATTSPFVAAVPTSIEVPDGDYAGFCSELASASTGFGGDLGVEEFRTLYREVDFDALIAASPSGLQPSLATIRDDREQVLTALEQITDFSELAPADLPAGWLDAIAVMTTAATQKCPGLAGSSTTAAAGGG